MILPDLTESVAEVHWSYGDTAAKLLCDNGKPFRFKTPWLCSKSFRIKHGRQLVITTESIEFNAWWKRTTVQAADMLGQDLMNQYTDKLELYSPDWFPDGEMSVYCLEIEIERMVLYEIDCAELILRLISVETKTRPELAIAALKQALDQANIQVPLHILLLISNALREC